jgi:hypothetical protein
MKIYLVVNAALYAIFALWCTLSPWRTATNIGFTSLSPSGRSEYLVVYGGMQLGFALIFAMLARGDVALQRLGIVASLCLYAPIVAYRVVAAVRFWPLEGTTLAVAALELGLLVAAAVLYVRTA